MMPYLYRLKRDSIDGYYYIQYRHILTPFIWFYLYGSICYNIETAMGLLKEVKQKGHTDETIN